jgi:teichuronic acid biosynthesis glycosyltransferase TuaC
VAALFSALDVGVVTLRDSEFGRYCFPQKLHEMLACGLPVVAAEVGAVSALLKQQPGLLYSSEDPSALIAAVLNQLDNPAIPAISTPDWTQLVAEIEPSLSALAFTSRR